MHYGGLVVSPSAFYEQRLSQLSVEEQELVKWSDRLSRFRGLTFLLALGFALYAWLSGQSWSIWYLLATVFFAVFVFLVDRHERLLGRLEICRERYRLNEAQQARGRRDWDRIPAITTEAPPEQAALARDLDVCGRASLLHWLTLAQTPMGKEMLRDWLLYPAEPEEIAARQEAVQCLAPEVALREELQVRGRLVSLAGHGPGEFLSWAEGPAWLGSRPVLKWGTRCVAIMILLVIGVKLIFGFYFPLAVLLMCLAVVNLVLNVRFVPTIHQQFNIVASRQNEVEQYRAAFQLFTRLPSGSRWLTGLRNKLKDEGSAPLRQLEQLARRVRFVAARNSPIWGLPYVLLQWLVLWDFHLLCLLEGWQSKSGHYARNWFEALAELEAIVSLSAVAHDNPDWVFPQVSATHTRFTASALGHPMIADDKRVTNDVTIGPAGTFLLVSGSNMSGKSTLLRSVGVNVMLAQAGAPICALDCNMPPLAVATSMRVADSLTDGVSLYLAELKRLKTVVDHADQLRDCADRNLLFLLDEILLGTNSAERRIAVVHVVQHLVKSGAIGAISTHDLELACSPELASACQAVHFRELIEDHNGLRQMSFDYKMRPGVATTTNALKLLELVGLGVIDAGALEKVE